MKILVIGSGGREHALAWKLKQSPRVSEVIVAPGNAGTARERGLRNADVAVTDLDGLLKLAKDEKIAHLEDEISFLRKERDRFIRLLERLTEAPALLAATV